MSINILAGNERLLMHSAAMLLLAGFVAGCSGGASRFNGVDDVFTASTSNQRQMFNQNQPYPGESQVAAAPVEGVQRGEVSRSALSPVSSQPLPAPQAQAAPVSARVAENPAPALAPVASAARVDQTVTGTVAKAAQAAPAAQMTSLDADPEGWSRAGGTQVTAKNGETVYNLSRRFGVPANVIMKMNGLSEQTGLQAGQKVIIPTYVYSNKAPVSAPDSNPNVADAKSSTGTKYDVPSHKVPLPSGASPRDVAVQAPKLAENRSATPAGAGTAEAAYTVQDGDTLSRIARKTGVGVAALQAANGLQDGNIRIGQSLRIPAAGTTAVAAVTPAVATAPAADPVVTGTTASATAPKVEKVAAYTPPKKAEKVIEQAEEYAAAAPDSTGIGRMRWPVRGRVISAFGKGSGKANDGIDIQVPQGTAVKAAENGVVIYAGDGLKEFGNTVLVRHDNGLVTVYGHASELKVSRGDKVKRGQQIASSGMSGVADSPRLHFEVRKNSAPVDPTTFLE